VQNEEENEETKMKICSLVSQHWQEQFSSNLVCRLAYLTGISVPNLVEFG